MNQKQSLAAIRKLQQHPATKHIQSKTEGDFILKHCTVCGIEDRREFPGLAKTRSPADVPVGRDEEIFSWFMAFADAHIHE